ncbi:MAG: hypothetical protein V1662_00125 [Candidatus Omnitrophota bacterium]
MLPVTTFAENMAGGSYRVNQGAFNFGAIMGMTSNNYNMNGILIPFAGLMSSSLYGIYAGAQGLNAIPQVTIDNYNDSKPVDDDTPTLQWIYTDKDNDSQKKYQLQVTRTDFSSPIIDTGVVSSNVNSYTTSVLPYTEEETGFKWRIRAHDGFDWSGWSQANNGFILSKAAVVISSLAALTAPGGSVIEASVWQEDNDPYFYWNEPPAGIELSGYSYYLDTLPDDTIDTPNTHYLFEDDSITDGTHTFYVQAQQTSGVWTEEVSFSLWVDATPPSAGSLFPPAGSVLSNDVPQIGALLADSASGIDPDTIELKVNQALAEVVYDTDSGEVSFVPSIPLSEGGNVVSLSARDKVGNPSVPVTWSFTVDTQPPQGTIVINNNDVMTNTYIVTLNLSARDDTSSVVDMMLSNDGIFDTEVWEPYVSLRKNWALLPVTGVRSVHALFRDQAGNVSEAVTDQINLVIVAPQTYIFSGPSGIIQSQDAEFTFGASLSGCQFSYKFDNEDWSDWFSAAFAAKTALPEGNHYFIVRAACDLNKDGQLQLDEVDPTPALRVWTISVSGALKPMGKPEKPIKYWREE